MACTPQGVRKRLLWWNGSARVMRKAPNGSTMLDAKPMQLEFHAADAPTANAAMRRLVDELLLPLFRSAPDMLVQFFTGSKKAGKKRARDAGGLSASSAQHYERMLAVVHVINILDVWRRETNEFLV